LACEGCRDKDSLHRTRTPQWENGYCESFNARFRDELLNGELFYTLKEAEIVIENDAATTTPFVPTVPLDTDNPHLNP